MERAKHPDFSFTGPLIRIFGKLIFSLAVSAIALFADSRQSFDSCARQIVMMPMRDGVKLATDVYLPAQAGKPVEGKYPVLVERTPYNKTGRRKLGELLARRGFIAVIQDSRGRYASQGSFAPFEEGRDGYDAIEWVATQPWSNGQVGSFGGSYTGMNQYYHSMLRPPHLAGMFVQMAGASLYDSVSYPGGTPNSTWIGWLLRSAASSPQAEKNKTAAEAIEKIVRGDFGGWLRLPPLERAGLLHDFPDYLELYRQNYLHPSYDAYWKQRRFSTKAHYEEMKDIPMMFVTGWYDNFMQGTLDVFTELSRIQKTEKKLMVGPWPHGIGTPQCGGAEFGPETAEDQGALVAVWFDYLFRGFPLEVISGDKARIYRMGGGGGNRAKNGKLQHGGQWRGLSRWPPDYGLVKYYIHSGGALRPDLPRDTPPSEYTFDPSNPVPTIGGRFTVAGIPPCIQDQVCSPKVPACKDALPLSRRADILSYSTAALDSAVEVTGRIRAVLWVSSDRPDTDFTAKLMDVYPNGYALNLADGEIRARYRNSLERPEMMNPGTAYEMIIDLGSTSNLFAAGHRIRLDISSSSFPKFEPNPNTGGPPGSEARRVTARNKVYHQPKMASYVELRLADSPAGRGH